MQTSSHRDDYAVVMAGGKGERFWPQSRLSHPKQLLRLLGNFTLIEQTVARISLIFPPENIIIVTNTDYVAAMHSLLAFIPENNIIGEPAGRDTAPCIALAAAYIKSIARLPDPAICVVPADHVINNTDSFTETIHTALDFVHDSARIVTVGIAPTFPSTGYGYIELGAAIPWRDSHAFRACAAFKEKPSLEVAEAYLAGHNTKWNAGMFMMTLSTLIASFQKYAPEFLPFYSGILDAFRKNDMQLMHELYRSVPKISFDYAVMEKSPDVAVIDANFDWDDVGSWTSMRNQIRPAENNNVVCGLHVGLDTSDCIVAGSAKHLIATVDVHDLVIVHTPDATLVCNAKSAQRIKELVQLIASKPELNSFL